MESCSIYNIESQQKKQLVQASNSLPANVNRYFNPVVYGANKVVLSRVKNNGGKYSTSREDNNSNPSKNSGYAKGSGSIYCRTITKNGKDYSQFFYSWKQYGKKRTKYIPKDLLNLVQEAVEQKCTVVEILKLLGNIESDPSKNPSNHSSRNISPSKNSLDLLGDMENNPSKNSSDDISPSKHNLDLLGDMQTDPSNDPSKNSSDDISPSKNDLDLLGDIATNPSKNPSNDSSGNISPSKNDLDLLGDMAINPSNDPSKNSSDDISPSKNDLDLLGDIATNPSKNPSNDSSGNISPSKNNLDLLGDIATDPSKNPSNDSSGNISPSKTRRKKGEGSGYVYWRLVNKNRKVYLQAYYHYEVWSDGDRLIKSSKYISKRVLPQILKLDKQKAPISDILTILRIII